MRRAFSWVLPAALLVGAAVAKDEAPLFEKGWKEPQVAVAPSGHAFVVAGADDSLEVAASKDGGKTWGKPTVVARAKVALGMRRGPRVAATDKSLVVAGIATDEEKKGN